MHWVPGVSRPGPSALGGEPPPAGQGRRQRWPRRTAGAVPSGSVARTGDCSPSRASPGDPGGSGPGDPGGAAIRSAGTDRTGTGADRTGTGAGASMAWRHGAVMAALAGWPAGTWPGRAPARTGRARPGRQVATPRVRRRMTTSMMLPPAAMLSTPASIAVRMSLMNVAAMLAALTAAMATTAMPIPLEPAPQPQQADPGLHMSSPFGTGGPHVHHRSCRPVLSARRQGTFQLPDSQTLFPCLAAPRRCSPAQDGGEIAACGPGGWTVMVGMLW